MNGYGLLVNLRESGLIKGKQFLLAAMPSLAMVWFVGNFQIALFLLVRR